MLVRDGFYRSPQPGRRVLAFFAEKRITFVNAVEFQQEFGQKALQRSVRNHPQMKVMTTHRSCATV